MSSYNFTQVSANATWTITHNLGSTSVAVDCFVDDSGDLTKSLPTDYTVVITDSNTLTVTYAGAESGQARVFGPIA